MIATPAALDVPLRTDTNGVIRVSGTRVTLHSIISTYHLGESPEAIHKGFPTVPLADVYAVIAYYLTHRAEVDAYLQTLEDSAAQTRQASEARHPQPSKAELQARLKAKKGGK